MKKLPHVQPSEMIRFTLESEALGALQADGGTTIEVALT
jgi:hypothetical protein